MPEVCLRLYHYASTCRRNTAKVELKSIFPAYHRCNCGTGDNRRTNFHIVYVLKLPPASSPEHRRHICEPGFTLIITQTISLCSVLLLFFQIFISLIFFLNAHFHCFEQVIIFKNRHAQVNATSLLNVRRLLFLIMTSNI
jgi:hypothetical protein